MRQRSLSLDRRTLRYGAVLALLGWWLPAARLAAQGAADDEFGRQVEAVQQAYRDRLAALAAACRGQGWTALADTIGQWAAPPPPWSLPLVIPEDLPAAPQAADTADADPKDPSDTAAWQRKFHQARLAQAETLFELARRAMAARRPLDAYRLALAALRENPDHEAARRVFGYQRYRDGWHTAFERRQMAAGQVWHPKFGWLPAAHVPRYEQGERFLDNRWMPAEEEAELRRRTNRPWQVRTERHLVTTNHSLEAGVALGTKLQRLYRAWQQTFPLYLLTGTQLQQLLEGRPTRRGPEPVFHVVLFRDRDDYIAALRPRQANIEITTGIYFAEDRKAYFFAGGQHSETTLYHEATHQLFHESRQVPADVGRRSNFWIIEGIACYMESLAPRPTGWTLGGAEALRLDNARATLLEDGFYVPLDQLCRLGMLPLQQHPQIASVYAQSAGLAHFLMHDHDGRYRAALMAYLLAVYGGRDHPGTLVEATGRPLAELDREYRLFLARIPQAQPADETDGVPPTPAPPRGAP